MINATSVGLLLRSHICASPAKTGVMEKAPPVTSDLVILAAFALQASQSLYQMIEIFRSEKRKVSESQYDFQSLSQILQAFWQVAAENQTEFIALKLPLLQCGKICKNFAKTISKCTTHYNGKYPKIWGGEIAAWRATLAAYKLVISIALCDAAFREAAVAIRVLDCYKQLLAEAICDLQKHSKLMCGRPPSLLQTELSNGRDIDETSNPMEEDESLKKCITICTEVSISIENSRSRLSREHGTGEKQASCPGVRNVDDAVTVTKEMLVEFQARLSEYSTIPDFQPNDMREDSDRDALAPPETARKMIFEDITSADNSHQLVVSTIGDQISARRISTGTMSVQWLGHMSNDTLQKLSKDRSNHIDVKQSSAQTGQGKFQQYGVGRNLGGRMEGGRNPASDSY